MKKNEFLEKLRKDLGYSRKKIAEYLEVSPTTIERYEKGKLPFNEKIKYIQGISALYGIDSSIFNIDIITENIVKERTLTKFSKQMRLLLYFLNFDITKNEYKKFLSEVVFSYFTKKTEFFINTESSPLSFSEIINCYQREEINFFEKSKQEDIIIKDLLRNGYLKCLTNQLIILVSLNIFNPKDFFGQKNIEFILQNYDELKISDFIKNLNLVVETDLGKYGITMREIYEIKEKILKEFNFLINKGIPLTKENIKHYQFKIGKLVKIVDEITPTDPKDKQICELLQYAPPAFKDKIIEKLLQYKKDVEEF